MKARCGAGFFAESAPSSREAGGTRGLARRERESRDWLRGRVKGMGCSLRVFGGAGCGSRDPHPVRLSAAQFLTAGALSPGWTSPPA